MTAAAAARILARRLATYFGGVKENEQAKEILARLLGFEADGPQSATVTASLAVRGGLRGPALCPWKL